MTLAHNPRVRRYLANGVAPGCNPHDHPNKTEYERHLNDLPWPADPPVSLLSGSKPARPGRSYGSWLRAHNYPLFIQQFEVWKKGYHDVSPNP